ncbi:MAG: hypothetical protein ACFFD1_00310 [Candidatus Thorarchaeota archaeon]
MIMNHLLIPNPDPQIILDQQTRSLSLFGGISLNASNEEIGFNPYAGIKNEEIIRDMSDFIDQLSPLIDDAYRTDLSAYQFSSKLVTSLYPLRKKIRSSPSSTSNWQLDQFLLHDFRTLQAILLQQFIEGRHTTFGYKPEKNQLLFLHILNPDARKIHEFIGQLELKILNLLARKGKIHYFNQQDTMLITMLMEEEENELKDDKMLYF